MSSKTTALPKIDLDPDIAVWEPGLTTIDLTRFETLSDLERRRVIVRVLCGLVALEKPERQSPPTAVVPAPIPGTHSRRRSGQAPRRRPMLDPEPTEIDLRQPDSSTEPPRRNRRRLPFLGLQRPF